MHAKSVIVGVLGVTLASAAGLQAQVYPVWFIEQGRVLCSDVATGYARLAYYEHSASGEAMINAQCNASKQRRSVLRGGEAFWQTAIGSAYLGSDIEEVYDTTACDTPLVVTGLDTFTCGNLVGVLVGGRACGLGDDLLGPVDCSKEDKPHWIENPPRQAGYVCAVGAAPVYFYEVSSWLEAEKRARMGLARSLGTRIRSLERGDDTVRDALIHDSLSVVLRGVQVVGRWREGTEVCYVLARMPANVENSE